MAVPHPEHHDLPENHPSWPWWRRLRRWLLVKVAGDDLVVLNAVMVVPTGWELHHKDLDQRGLVSGVTFMRPGTTVVPHTRILHADWSGGEG